MEPVICDQLEMRVVATAVLLMVQDSICVDGVHCHMCFHGPGSTSEVLLLLLIALTDFTNSCTVVQTFRAKVINRFVWE